MDTTYSDRKQARVCLEGGGAGGGGGSVTKEGPVTLQVMDVFIALSVTMDPRVYLCQTSRSGPFNTCGLLCVDYTSTKLLETLHL